MSNAAVLIGRSCPNFWDVQKRSAVGMFIPEWGVQNKSPFLGKQL